MALTVQGKQKMSKCASRGRLCGQWGCRAAQPSRTFQDDGNVLYLLNMPTEHS